MRVALPLLTAAFAVAMPTKSITTIAIEALHEGFGTGLTNLTITVPVGPAYVNKAALRAVSALYILENDATSCIPYQSERAFGPQLVFLSLSPYFGNDSAATCCILMHAPEAPYG
ncbi:hypothetical protein F4782DRAFT_525534 [Xylaria castorea]|nr:hypothetical protein F4782DRAFT_525534 [Xylaria castorea]